MLSAQEKVFLVATAVTTSAVTVGSVVGGHGGFGGDGTGVTEQVALFEAAENLPDTTEILSGMGVEISPNYNLEPVINVELPSMMAFSIDPFEIQGMGQIFSSGHSIINYSNVDVIVKVKSAHYAFANDTDFKSFAEPFDSSSTIAEKAIYMLLNSDTEGFQNVVVTNEPREYLGEFYLKASSYDESNTWMNLNEGSQVSLFVGGIANCYPAIPWGNGDVSLTVDFEIEPVIPILPIVEGIISDAGLEPVIISGDGFDIGVTSESGIDVEVTSESGIDLTNPEATLQPTEEPVVDVTPQPTEPIVEVTPQPTEQPAVEETPQPTEEPAVDVTPQPTEEPVVDVTPQPTEEPVIDANPVPSDEPIIDVTAEPTSELNI